MNFNQLNPKVAETIEKALHVSRDQVTDIKMSKKGMTNRSFLFKCQGKKFIMRLPGEGTDKLIQRKEEYEVYQAIAPLRISDAVCYFNPENGYKISEFLEGARVCDAGSMEDVAVCMGLLRAFHEKNIQVSHTFDLFGQIDFYESLWGEAGSCFEDYRRTRANVFSLREYIDKQKKRWTLTHMDAVSDNFLLIPGGDGKAEEARLIDWEYAGMQDASVDIAMFAVYAMYGRRQVEQLMEAYYREGCERSERLKVYCYIAACGLLWSNWCEYKRSLGISFGEYAIRQYRYAKEYYEVFMEESQK